MSTDVKGRQRIKLLNLFLFVFIFLLPHHQAFAKIYGKNERTSNIPIDYKPFLSGIGSFKVGRATCTAFCVAADVVVTSQHCLQLTNERWRSSPLRFRFSAEHKGVVHRSSVFGKTTKERKVNIAFGLKRVDGLGKATKRRSKRPDSDWTLIRLKSKICHSVLPVKSLFGLASRTLPGRQHAGMVSAERFGQRSAGKRWTYSGKCQFLTPNVRLAEGAVFHNCDSIRGTSGSPILMKDDVGELVVVAVNSGFQTFTERTTNKKEKLNRATKSGLFADSISHFLSHERISDPMKLSEIQTALKKRHHLKGRIDGVFGPDTRFAIIMFEHSIGLPELGLPSVLIYELLKGQREIPKGCFKAPGKYFVPPECRKIGLPQ